MTDSQVTAAAARCWIDAETPVRKPQSSEWTKLGDVAPAKRITAEKITDDIDTSAMILVSGEFEVVDDSSTPTKEELAAARPKSLAPKMLALAVVMLAGGGLLARRHVPKLDAELDAVVAAMRPAPVPTVATLPATTNASTPTVATAAQAPIPITVTSSSTLAIVPKMRAPAPKMPEPSAPIEKAADKLAQKAPEKAPKKPATHAKVKAKPARATLRH